MSRFSVSYHDNSLADETEPFVIDAVTEGDSVLYNGGPYYRLRIGYDLTVFLDEPRLRELARLIDATPPLPKVNTPAATQIEDCATAQSGGESEA